MDDSVVTNKVHFSRLIQLSFPGNTWHRTRQCTYFRPCNPSVIEVSGDLLDAGSFSGKNISWLDTVGAETPPLTLQLALCLSNYATFSRGALEAPAYTIHGKIHV